MPIRVLRAKRVVLIGALAVAVAGVSLGVTIFVGPFALKEPSAVAPRERRAASIRMGDARALQASYEQWKAQYARTEGDRILALPLGYSKGLSTRFTNAQGHVRLDLATGTILVEVSGLPTKEPFDVWLVDNRPGRAHSVRPEAGDNLVRVGRFERVGDSLALRGKLGPELLTGFELDLVVVTPAGGHPGADGLLFGTPSLFHRLYYREQRTMVAAAGGATATTAATTWTPFSVLVPRPAWAQAPGTDLQAMIEHGRQLFFEETFNGNGRTCGTCHDAQNNLTIDPAFIARLPKNDPLFVAETQDALKCENPHPLNPTGCKFEHPVLMRKFGLILENVDGFHNPGVMRGVPHTLALKNSLGLLGNATGWSGDGAPAPGTLRQFAIGAITQHFTRSLNRDEGADFRLPTPGELDAMEAFQLSLGRQTDLVLTTMLFTNPIVEQGKQLFVTTPGGGSCNACHANAGAKAAFGGGDNRNFDTGVENVISASERRDAHGNVIRPRDGGRGPEPAGVDSDGFSFFGDGTFNTPVLVEAATKKTFFHNNVVKTIEEAVDSYNSPAFNTSPGAAFGQIQLTPEQVNAIAAFLRVVGAREKIRSSTATLQNARQADFEDAKALLEFSISEDSHAISVLNARGLHRNAVRHLRLAQGLAAAASRTPVPTLRSLLIGRAITQHKAACGDLVQEPACGDLEPESTP